MLHKSKSNGNSVYLIILAVTFLLSYSYTFDSKLAMLGDNASYYTLGKALSLGEGYVNISKVSHSPNNHYPPGYPAIIALVMLFTSSILAIKIINGLFFLGALYFLYQLFRLLTKNDALSFVTTLLVLINSHLLWYSSIMMSEVPFFFFSTLSIYAFIKTDFEKLTGRSPYLIIAVASLIIAYYIRSLGVALLGGYFLYFLIHRKWKPVLIFFLSFVGAALPWLIRGQKLGGGSYMKQLSMVNPYQPALGQASFGDFIDRIFENFTRYITREIPSALFPVKNPEYNTVISGDEWLLGIVVLALIIFGIISLPEFRWIIGGYILATLAILMIWPDVWIGVRFVVPVIPFFALGFFYGIYMLLVRVRNLLGTKKQLQGYGLLVFLILYIKPLNALNEQAKRPYSPAWENYFKVAKWLDKNADSDVVVSCGKPSLFYLYSNTYTMRYKFAEDPQELIADLEKQKVDYVVIDQVYGNTFRYLLPAVRQHPERFEQVFHLRNPDTFLLKFKQQ